MSDGRNESSGQSTATLPLATHAAPVIDTTQPEWREASRRDFLQFRVRAQRELGDVIDLRFPASQTFQVTHPDDLEVILRGSNQRFEKGPTWDHLRQMIGNGTITTEPGKWLEQRRTLQPNFLRRYHDRFAERIGQGIAETNARWSTLARSGEPVPVALEMARLTLSNAGHVLFGAKLENEIPAISENMIFVLRYLQDWHSYPARKRKFGAFVPGTRHQQYRRALSALEKVAREILRQRQTLRRQKQDEPEDLLASLLNAQKSGSHNAQLVRDEIMTFLFTGHETTAMALSWTWHILAGHPEVEEKLYAELSGVLQGRIPTRADLPNLPYLYQVVSETLRLFPPVWVMMRRTTQPENFRGIDIPRGSNITLLPYVTHRHPDFWAEPEKFDPERFTPEREAERHHFAFIPFGGGPRQCLGKQTALLETQLVIAGLAQHWRPRPVPDYNVRTIPSLTLWPSGNLPMTLQPRH